MTVHPSDKEKIRSKAAKMIGKSGADPFSMEYVRTHAYQIEDRYIIVPFNYDQNVFYLGEAKYIDETELDEHVEVYSTI